MKSVAKRLPIRLFCGLILLLLLLMLGGCESSSSSTSRSYTSKEDAYDAKYGKGSYAADKALLDSMRDAYNSSTGN